MPHIFSVFPQILFLAPAVYALYRATVATFLAYDAYAQYQKRGAVHQALAIAQAIAALGLIVGAYAQAAALLAAACMLVQLVFPKYRIDEQKTTMLLFIMSLGQVFLGAGIFAIDLPL